MLTNIFGSKETLEELITKKPFNEKAVEKRLSKYEIDSNNPYLIHLCAKHDCSDAILYLINQKGMNVNSINAEGENALFTAIRNRAVNSCKVLLVNKVNLNHENLNGATPLHISAEIAFMDIFNILANYAKDKEKKDKSGRNVLFYAIKSKSVKMVKRVLEIIKLDLNERDNQNNTISHLPEIAENRELLDELIDLGLDIDAINDKKEDFIYINCLNLDLDEDIIDFALKNSTNLNKEYELRDNNILKRIIRKILSIDVQVFENKAVITKYQDRFLTFLDHGINVNSLNKHKENILFDIVRERDEITLEFILNRTSIDINQVNMYGESLLDIAIFNVKPNSDVIKNLIYSNIDCTIKDKDGDSVIEKLIDVILSEALMNRKRKIGKTKTYPKVNYNQFLNLILDYAKVDINELTFHDEPLVFEAARSFYVPLLEIFKKYGANLNIVCKKSNLNIYYKVLESGKNAKDEKPLFLKTLNFLVSANVDLDHRDSYGGTVLHKAILDHDLQVINVLTKKTVDFTPRDRKGRTYIHNCIWSGKVDILKKFALKDRDLINVPDKFGLLPINYAVIMGEKEIVFTLIKLGAFLNNPNKVNQVFKEQFFSKLGRLDDILNSSMSVNERNLMTKLVASMQSELNIK